ncbi:MAG: hypothetical protein ABJC09_13200 [Terriglobia bacterium]
MRHSISALILCLGLATAGALSADIAGVSPCTVNTLAYYSGLTKASPCSVGILLFSDFTFAKSGSGASETPTDIILSPFANTNNVGGGFAFSRENPTNLNPAPAFTVSAGQSAKYVIDWYFLIDPGPVGSGADLGMDPPFGDVRITQNYCLDSDFLGNGCTNEKPRQSLFVDVANPFQSKKFHPVAELYGNVMTTIDINGLGTDGDSGFDSVSSSESVTPEPVYGALVFAGLLGIATLRKFKRQG